MVKLGDVGQEGKKKKRFERNRICTEAGAARESFGEINTI